MRLLDRRWFVVASLIVVMIAGCYVRFDSLPNWLENKDRFFFADQQIPLMLTVDSYYYLELARQLQEGTFIDFDARRHVPVGYSQPATPPLLSVLLARISKLAGVSLEWVALVIPVFFGILLAIPMYLLSYTLAMKAKGEFFENRPKETSARLVGLVAAFLALLSPFFARRSGVGWCDTDALNVTFPVLLSYLAIKCADSEELKRQLGYLGGFVVTSLLFLWWWDQSHIPVFAFTAITLIVALFFTWFRTAGKVLPVLSAGILLIVLVGWWKGFGLLSPLAYLDTMKGMMKYISSEVGTSPFRAAGVAVSEQSRTSLALLIRESSGWWPGFLLACSGLLALAWVSRWYVLYLLPLVLVSMLSLQGQRFLIFTAPLFGLGIGTLCFLIFHWITKPVWRALLLVFLLGVAGLGAVMAGGAFDRRVPRRAPVLFDAMQQLQEKTEENAVIWASWGHGHPLLYYSRRGVIADGIFHSAELQYVFNFPLATNDFRLAANWISFNVARGSEGLRKANKLFATGTQDWAAGMGGLQHLLGAGVQESRKLLFEKYHLSKSETEETLEWLFPEEQRPAYLFLDYLLLNQAWYTIGQWNLGSRSGPGKTVFCPIQGITSLGKGKVEGVSGVGKILIDIKNGRMQTGKGEVLLSGLRVHDGRHVKTKRYQKGVGVYARIFLPGRMGVLAGRQTSDTVLVKLFFEYTYNRRFFSPVTVGNPYYAVWKVSGERYRLPSR